MSKYLFCSKKKFLLYFLKNYYNLMYIGYRYRPIRQKIISVFYRYRPIRNLNLSVIIGIGRYEKKLIGRPLIELGQPFKSQAWARLGQRIRLNQTLNHSQWANNYFFNWSLAQIRHARILQTYMILQDKSFLLESDFFLHGNFSDF